MQISKDDFLDIFENSDEKEIKAIEETEEIEEIEEKYKKDKKNKKDEEEDEEDEEEKEKKGGGGSALDIYGIDITQLAREGKLDECFGREKELSELMEILVRRQKNNPVLVGDAGVGKSAIVELFATKLVNNLVPFVLEGRAIISLDLARIVAGSRYRGEFEARFRKILDEAISEPNLIIFIDEIHTLSGTGSAEGSLDAANMLKPILARTGFQCIGATTTKEYEKIERDPALHRRFQPIIVKQPSVEETISILYSLRAGMESFHNLEFSPGALKAAAELSHRYINDRFLPDKAIDLIDRTAAKEVIELTSPRENSIINGIVNGALCKIGTLKNEAFRRGDIGCQFIFQELETAYRSFLFTWVQNPRDIPLNAKAYNKKKNGKILRSPISQELFDKMRYAVLTRTEELLFASTKSRFKVQPVKHLENLSADKANFVLANFFYSLEIFDGLLFSSDEEKRISYFKATSMYRISLSLFSFYRNFEKKLEPIEGAISALDITSNEEKYKKAYYYFLHKKKKHASSRKLSKRLSLFLKLIKKFTKNSEFVPYIRKVRDFNRETTQPISKNFDFLRLDIEHTTKTFEYLSELETVQTNVIEDFFQDLKPLMEKGLVQSFRSTSAFKITDQQLERIYTLLGYYSTETGKNFLESFYEPEILNDARKRGNYAGLKTRIGPSDVKKLLSSITGIPIQTIGAEEKAKLVNLEKILHERVVGQEDAISAISRAIRRARLGIQNPNRPIASFFFCGPTGVGKTEVCKALAYTMFGSEKDMIRFDMSEFMEKFTVSRLIGSPPGYIGYEEGGQLSDAVRRKPYSVVLFDEVEKAHPDVLNILLQILEDGRLTDTQKRLISFENTIIIMTSNVGAGEIQDYIRENPEEELELEPFEDTKINSFSIENEKGKIYLDPYMGTVQFLKSPIKENFLADIQEEIQQQFKDSFKNITDYKVFQRRVIKQIEKELGKKLDEKVTSGLLKGDLDQPVITPKKRADTKKDTLKTIVLQKLGEFFLPEFLNRLDDIIVFKPLQPFELRRICDFMIDEVTKRMRQKNIEINVDNFVKTKVTKEGYNPAFGARPLRRLITKYIEDLVSENVLKAKTSQGKTMNFHIRLDHMNQIVLFNLDSMEKKVKKSLFGKEEIIDVTTLKTLPPESESLYDLPFKNRDYDTLRKNVNNAFLQALKMNAFKPLSQISPPTDAEIQKYEKDEDITTKSYTKSIYDIFAEVRANQQTQKVENSSVDNGKKFQTKNINLDELRKIAKISKIARLEAASKSVATDQDRFGVKPTEKPLKTNERKKELVSI